MEAAFISLAAVLQKVNNRDTTPVPAALPPRARKRKNHASCTAIGQCRRPPFADSARRAGEIVSMPITNQAAHIRKLYLFIGPPCISVLHGIITGPNQGCRTYPLRHLIR